MLKKLLKHDFITTWKVPAAVYAVLIVLGLITAISVQGVNHFGESFGMSLLMFSAIGLFYIGIIAANITMLIYLVIRYYRSMYTSEGYLTFTLPVKTDMIFLSKVITGSVWMFLSYICTFISLAIAGIGFIKATDIPADEFRTLLMSINEVLGLTDPGLISIFVYAIIITPIAGIVCIYFCVSIGQLWQNHKILGSVLCFIALYIINQLVSQIAMFGSGFWQMMRSSPADIDMMFRHVYLNMMLTVCIITTLEAIAFYIVCLIINRKKINLD